MTGKLLTLKAAGERLGVSDRTIQNLIERGLLHGFQVASRWRVEETEIEAYIERQKDKATAIEERQPGALELIAESVQSIEDKEEREETELLMIELMAAHKHLKAILEKHGLVFTNALTPDGPVTVTLSEEKKAELAAARR
jgi:excisionase family DNA binding protein